MKQRFDASQGQLVEYAKTQKPEYLRPEELRKQSVAAATNGRLLEAIFLQFFAFLDSACTVPVACSLDYA